MPILLTLTDARKFVDRELCYVIEIYAKLRINKKIQNKCYSSVNPVKINEIARKPDGEMSRKVNCRRKG